MTSDIQYELSGILAAEIDAFANIIEQRDLARSVAVQLEGENAHLDARHKSDQAEIRRLRAIAEPECWCEFVDIGVGMQKVAENRECPACWPEARQEYEHRKFVEGERDDLILRLERALADLSALRDAPVTHECWRCGGAA